jgi:hypothetical protein
MSRSRILTAPGIFFAGLLIGFVATIGLGIVAYAVTAESYSDLKQEGEGYIKLIEAFRERQGSYPVYLEEADIHPKKTRYGTWRYRLEDDQQQFSISIGDYDGWDPFVLTWSSKRGEWYLDN